MKHITRKKFDDDDEAKDEMLRWLNEQVRDFYDSGIKSSSPDSRNALRNMVTM
jgi:hypothetical protein